MEWAELVGDVRIECDTGFIAVASIDVTNSGALAACLEILPIG